MLDFLIMLNLVLMAIIFGYGFAVTSVSYPAMMASSREVAVGYFKPFFHKSAHLQMLLSLLVIPVSAILSYMTQEWWWLAAALILQISGPYTIFVLMPLNRRIMAEDADIHSEQMTKDLNRWGKLHFPRTVIAGVIFIFFCYLAIV